MFYYFVPGDTQYDYFWAFVKWLEKDCQFDYLGQILDNCIVNEQYIFDIICPVIMKSIIVF